MYSHLISILISISFKYFLRKIETNSSNFQLLILNKSCSIIMKVIGSIYGIKYKFEY